MIDDDLIWSSRSLLEYRRLFEHGIVYVHEAFLKTYPTKFLTKAIVRCLCKKFRIDKCLTQMALKLSKLANDSELMLYDLNVDKFTDWEPSDGIEQQAMLKFKCMNIEEDVAGRITYCMGIVSSDVQNDTQIFNSASEELIECGQRFGYDYIAQSTQHDIKHHMLLCFVLFESKMQEAEIEIEDDLWHIAPFSAKDKILKNGLTPKSKTFKSGEKVNHSDRVYLFNGYDKDIISRFLNQLQKMSFKYDPLKKQLEDEKKYVLFKIDRKKIPDLKLYRDNNFMSEDPHHLTALYTYSCIPASAIEVYDTAYVN